MFHKLCLGFLACFCLVGCSDDWQAVTHPVSGIVTVNGEPAKGAVVTLYPAGTKVDVRNSRPWAIAADDGSFQLQTYEPGDGAPLGKYDVTVTWPLDVTKMDLAMIDQLNGAFSRPEKSQWKVEIQEGDNQLARIEIDGIQLKSKAKSTTPRGLPRGPEMGQKP